MSSFRHRCITYSQNVLCNPKLVDRLLDRSGIAADDLVIEIGPGRGVITDRLAARCRQVLAVEKDSRLVEDLRVRFGDAGNVALFEADFLEFPLPMTAYKVFANIPFNITSAIVAKLTSGASPPGDAYLAMQREAAERFLGTPRETLVAVLLKPWFEPAVVHRFRPSDFCPAPGVDVVLLRLRRREVSLVAPEEAAIFDDLAAYVFSAWRPTVREALVTMASKRQVMRIEREAGVALAVPPGELPFSAWSALASTFRDVAGECTAARGARLRLEQQQANLEKDHRTRARTRRSAESRVR
jgi:23S rRNA (adenine-N6)-dimethyltransferase